MSTKPKSTKQSVSSPSQALAEFAAILLADVIRDLSLDETKAGRIARMICRAERDGKSASVRRFTEPLGLAVLKAMPNIRKRDKKTGRWLLNFSLPAEWR